MRHKMVVIGDETPGHRRWLAWAAAATAVIALGLWLVDRTPATPPPPATAPNVPDAALQPWHAVLLGMAEPHGDAAQPLEPGVAHLCDVGRVELEAGGAPPAAYRNHARDTLQRLIDRQAGASAELTQARKAYLQMREAERVAAERRIAAQPGCADDERCRALAYRDRTDDRWTNELARLAAGSRDPQVYALGFHACRGYPGGLAPTGCAGISALHWSQLDPDNGIPLLFAAAEADARRDIAQRDELIARMARARRLDPAARGWIEVMGNGGFAAQPRSTQVLMLHELVDLASIAPPPYHLMQLACTPERLRDPARRETCNQLAETLTRENATMVERQMGMSIGARVGWPAERLTALRDEIAAVQAVGRHFTAREGMFSCDALDKLAPWLLDRWAWGELPAARSRIQASGRSLQQWAADGQQASQPRQPVPLSQAAAAQPLPADR